jgi:glycosyltransferase involved in cell wall biosynthesis
VIGPLRLLIYEGYASEKITGELRTVLYLLQHLDRRQFEPHVVVPCDVPALRETASLTSAMEIVQPPQSLLPYGGTVLNRGVMGRLASMLDLAKYALVMQRYVRKKRIDVIYCCSLRAVLLVGISAFLARRPLLFFVNGRLQNPVLDAIAFALARRIVFQCSANCNDRYPLLRRLFRRKFAVVPSGVDLKRIEAIGAKRMPVPGVDVGAASINVIVLGLLNREKGVDVLLRALARQSHPLQDVRLWVVGDQLTEDFSDYRQQLVKLTRELGLSETVTFLGWRTDALEILASMDVLVHPSLSEGMPRAVLEGMALGKAIIATRVGCTREAIRDGENGLLVDAGSVDQLAAALERVFANAELRRVLGQAAAATIAREHQIEDKIRELEVLITGMAQAPANRH